MVTVQCSRRRSRARGLPTMLLRPMTTARSPTMGTLSRFSISRIPAGVQGTKAGLPVHSFPTFTG